MSPSSPIFFPLSVTFHFDRSVTTGTDIAGGVDSVVEKDEHDLPIVRTTVLAGIVREQSLLAAQALDDDSSRSWRAFASALFDSDQAPRFVTLSDARLTDPLVDPTDFIHKVVSLSIDEKTGTMHEDLLRLFEHAGTYRLRGEVTLSDVGQDGCPLTWNDEQRNAAELLLALADLLMRTIGSNRTVGDDVCDVLIHADHGPGDTRAIKDWYRTQLGRWKGRGAPQPSAADTTITATPALQASRASAVAGTFHEATLTIDLRTSVVSYEVPMSNEIRFLDFLHGTVLLPWVHRLVTRTVAQAPGASKTLVRKVRDAVVNGGLLVSDGIVSYQGEHGLTMPLVFPSPKVGQGATSQELKTAEDEDDEETCICNRMRTEEPEHEVHKPLRNEYVFPTVSTKGAPALIGQRSTAHDVATGAARDGQLYLVRALPAGLSLQTTVTVSTRLYQRIGEQLEALTGAGHRTCLRAHRLNGTFGETECTLSTFTPSPAPQVVDAEGMVIWPTSDVLAHSSRLGPGGNLTDLLAAFERADAPIELAEADGARFNTRVRHQRVGSWSVASHQPRTIHMAIQAGSILKVRATAPEKLAALATVGIREPRAQGFGWSVVRRPLLERETFTLRSLHREDLAPTADGAAASEEAQR